MINLNDKKFTIQQNSENGEVSNQTVFAFVQIDKFVSGSYSGGRILKGQLIGIMSETNLKLNYQCITEEQVLKSGSAQVSLAKDNQGLIKMEMDWTWLSGDVGSGKSSYVEILNE